MHLKCLVEKTPCSSVVCVQKICIKHFHFSLSWFAQRKKAEESFFQTFKCKTYDLSLGLYIASKRWCIPNILQFLTEHFLMYAAACCMITSLGIKLNIKVTINWRKEFLQCIYVFSQNIFCFKFLPVSRCNVFYVYRNIQT